MTYHELPLSHHFTVEQSEASRPPELAPAFALAKRLASLAAKYWKEIALAVGLMASLTGVEYFVTHCAFSSQCPGLERIVDTPVGQSSESVAPTT
jgi:hypothetical protein